MAELFDQETSNGYKRDLRRETYRDPSRREEDYRRETFVTDGGTIVSPNKPKMEKPETYNGEYTVLYSVLNWLKSVQTYLERHDIPISQYPQYAYAYMGKSVKAWYDGLVGDEENLPWSDFCTAIKERYLPTDHVLQVTKQYENVTQTGTLEDYVEKWQSLMVAVRAAKINRSEEDHVIQFVTGLARLEDRKAILDHDPKTLVECYRHVTTIRHYTLLAHRYDRTGGNPMTQENHDALEILQGAAKTEAFPKGVCIGCGKLDHFLANCPMVQQHLKILKRFEKAANRTSAGTGTTKGTQKGVRFHGIKRSKPGYGQGEHLGDPENKSGTDLGAGGERSN